MTTVIGLTGQTGAGKTTVSDALRAHGVPVIDADLVARDVANNSKSCLGDLVLAFGCEIINHNGELDRKKLGRIVFGDRQKLRRLNAITHPHIVARMEETVQAYRAAHAPLLVLDAPTLYEAGCERLCSYVIAVIAPQEERLRRIMARDGLSEADALSRIRSQHDDDFYRTRARYVVENTGTPDELLQRLSAILAGEGEPEKEAHETENL